MTNDKKGINASPFSEPAKKVVPPPPNPLETPSSKNADEFAPFCVPFVGKSAGVNVWIPGKFTLTEEQAVQKAQNMIVEAIFVSGVSESQLNAVGIFKKPERDGVARHEIKHTDGRSYLVANWDTLGRAFRLNPKLAAVAKPSGISPILK